MCGKVCAVCVIRIDEDNFENLILSADNVFEVENRITVNAYILKYFKYHYIFTLIGPDKSENFERYVKSV